MLFTTMFVCINHGSSVTLAGGHCCRCGSGCVVGWRHVLFAADSVLPSDAKYCGFISKDIRSSRLWSSLAPSLVQVCCSPSSATSHLFSSSTRASLSQEKRCTLSDLRAMLSMPWFLDSVPTSLKPLLHNVLLLSPQFFAKSSVDESKSSQPPCKPRMSRLKGFGWWSLKMKTKLREPPAGGITVVRALTL